MMHPLDDFESESVLPGVAFRRMSESIRCLLLFISRWNFSCLLLLKETSVNIGIQGYIFCQQSPVFTRLEFLLVTVLIT